MFERFRRRGDSAGDSSAPDSGSGAVSAQQADRSARPDGTALAERDDARGGDPERRFTRGAGDHGTSDAAGAATSDGPARERRNPSEVGPGREPAARSDERATARDEAGAPRPRRRPVVARETMAAVRARQREHFGGFKWGSAFFGFLTALGLATIFAAILAAAGVALGLADQATGSDASGSDAQTIGIGGGVALLVALAIAWYCGGYVAGRMARFDGVRQGLAVWVWTLAAVLVVAAAAAIGGSKYDVFQNLHLPSVPVNGSTLTRDGTIAGAAAIVVTLLFAVLGGRAGDRFHRRVDRVAHEDVEA